MGARQRRAVPFVAVSIMIAVLGVPLVRADPPRGRRRPVDPFLPTLDEGDAPPATGHTGPRTGPRSVPRERDDSVEESDREVVVDSEVGAPAPAWARSVEVQRGGAPVRTAPSLDGARRGQLAFGERFPILDRRLGTGCEGGPWFRIAPEAWVCSDYVWPSAEPAAAREHPTLADGEVVPFRYAFTAVDGTRAYARPSDLDADDYLEALAAGWGLAIVGRRVWQGNSFVRTTRQTYVLTEELRWAHPSDFVGIELPPLDPGAPIPVAWVRSRRSAPTFQRPGDRRRAGLLPGRALVRVPAQLPGAAARTTVQLEDGRFVEARSLVSPQRVPRPEGVGPSERWVDVDLARQVLVAYEGDRPVYATLVSTGRHAGSTPRGLHRIWIKVALATMDNVEDEEAEQPYSMDGVPWVQYFAGDGVALHGAYWHDRFGTVRSHGCVNLAPRDARWLYQFTRPAVPEGWMSILPTDHDPASVVQVR